MADSTDFDSYLPLYDTVPPGWEQARQFLIEQLKKISDMVNIRQIGWYLEQELLSGEQFIPGVNNTQEFRSGFRKVINTGALISGANVIPHGITFDANFTLTNLYGAGTQIANKAAPIPNGTSTIYIDTTNIIINSSEAYDRSFVVIEYLKEL